jgi:rare lipoprotein A
MRLSAEKFLPLAALSLLAACGGGARPYDAGHTVTGTGGPAADYPMVIGAPFTVDGITYTPSDTMNYDAVGYAEVGPDGGSAVSAAHRSLPLPSYVEVTALDTGKTILVRVERRGPMRGKALLELSPGAAAQLGVAGMPRAPIRVRRVNPVEQDRALLRMSQPAPARMDTPKSLLTVLVRKLDQQEGIIPAPLLANPIPEPTTPRAPVPVKGKPGKPLLKPLLTPLPKPAPVPALIPLSKSVVAPVHGKYAVQVGAFANRAHAQAAASKIAGSVSPVGKLWRVRLGPYASDAEAKAALVKAKAAGYSDARIQRTD